VGEIEELAGGPHGDPGRHASLANLDSGACSPLHSPFPMGQQLNKVIKRKRRRAYLKRKKAAAKKK
jgi:hypothetical protein